MVSVDIMNINRLFLQCHFSWITPLYISLAMYFLWQQLGWACLPGLVILLGVLPASSAVVARHMNKLQVEK